MVQIMEELYSTFRFSHREVLRNYSERSVRAVFEEVWFFIHEIQPDIFTHGDLLFYLDTGMKERGIAVPELDFLTATVTAFIAGEAGMVTEDHDLYEDIFGVVAGIVPRYTDDPDKFTGLLARRITDEFKTGDFEMTMEECALKLKEYPELRFLPLPLLQEAVNSVYDYFMQFNEER